MTHEDEGVLIEVREFLREISFFDKGLPAVYEKRGFMLHDRLDALIADTKKRREEYTALDHFKHGDSTEKYYMSEIHMRAYEEDMTRLLNTATTEKTDE